MRIENHAPTKARRSKPQSHLRPRDQNTLLMLLLMLCVVAVVCGAAYVHCRYHRDLRQEPSTNRKRSHKDRLLLPAANSPSTHDFEKQKRSTWCHPRSCCTGLDFAENLTRMFAPPRSNPRVSYEAFVGVGHCDCSNL